MDDLFYPPTLLGTDHNVFVIVVLAAAYEEIFKEMENKGDDDR